MRNFGFLIFSIMCGVFSITNTATACVGARALAMGGAYVALASGAEAAYWNPAALVSEAGKNIFYSMPVSANTESNYDFTGIYSQSAKQGLSGAIAVFKDVPSDNSGISRSSLTYSIASNISKLFDAGMTLRYEKVTDKTTSIMGTGFGIDFGIARDISKKIRIGLLIQDAFMTKVKWNNGSSEKYGVNIRPGILYKPNETISFNVDGYNIGAGILPFSAAEGVEIRSGFEKNFILQNESRISIRMGVEKGFGGVQTNVSGGIGYSFPYVDGASISLDYAIKKQLDDRANVSHFLSAGLSF